MTKKRFSIEPTITRECIVDNITGEQLDTVDYVERLCEVLNGLYEEKKRLKRDNAHLKVSLHSLQDSYSGLLRLVHGFVGDVE